MTIPQDQWHAQQEIKRLCTVDINNTLHKVPGTTACYVEVGFKK